MDAKLTENVIFVRVTGEGFLLQFVKLTFVYTQIISSPEPKAHNVSL